MKILLILLVGILYPTHQQSFTGKISVPQLKLPQLQLPQVRVAAPEIKLPFQISRPALKAIVKISPATPRVNVNAEDILQNEWNSFKVSFD